MDDQDQVLLAQLQAQIMQSSARFLRLENDATELSVRFGESSLQQDRFVAELTSQIALLEQEVEDVRSSLHSLLRDLSHVTSRFRDLVKRDLLAEVEHKADAWQLEFFITRNEFDALVHRSFSS